MSTIILKSISAKNYAAFADGITFTTQIDTSKKEYLDNIGYYCLVMSE